MGPPPRAGRGTVGQVFFRGGGLARSRYSLGLLHSPGGRSDSATWRRGVVVSGVRRMNEVNARRTRLVPGWLTVFGRVYRLGM